MFGHHGEIERACLLGIRVPRLVHFFLLFLDDLIDLHLHVSFLLWTLNILWLLIFFILIRSIFDEKR